MEMSIGVKLH